MLVPTVTDDGVSRSRPRAVDRQCGGHRIPVIDGTRLICSFSARRGGAIGDGACHAIVTNVVVDRSGPAPPGCRRDERSDDAVHLVPRYACRLVSI